MENTDKSNKIPEMDDQAKKIFNEFKRKKRSLPSPSNVELASAQESKKQRNRDIDIEKRSVRRLNAVDLNRKIVTEFNDVSMDDDIKSSTISEKFISMHNTSDHDQTEVFCDQFEQELASTLEMIHNKADMYEILEKIVNNISQNYKKMRELVQKVNNDCVTRSAALNSQMVLLENDLIEKINSINEKNESRFKAMELTEKCKNENCLVWLSFADPHEAESLRMKSRSELITETKKILSRMQIRPDHPMRTIVDVFIQKVAIKTNKGFENELLMGIRFMNANASRDVKRLAINYAKQQYLMKNYDEIRYVVRDNWTTDIWKLLRVCYDLSRLKLIDGAQVSDIGILVYRKTAPDQNGNLSTIKTIVRTENDLDELRENVGDICLEIPTFQLYNGDYFKLNYEERNTYRSAHKNAINNVDSCDNQQQQMNPNSQD